jgi:S1-C subfamily serine protease
LAFVAGISKAHHFSYSLVETGVLRMFNRTPRFAAYLILSLGILLAGSGCGFLKQTPAATATQMSTTTAPPPPAVPILDYEEAAAYALQNQVISVYEAVGPAVVNITSLGYVQDFFMRPIPQEGSGSGFVYDSDGHIVTNFHVVENAQELLVTLANGNAHEAALVGTDPANDLAVLRIDAKGELPHPMVVGDSDQLRVGQFVLAIGNPFGLEQTLTTGVISALGRVIESPEDNRFIGEAIQTDAAINPGNSGGPLMDLMGHVIGVNSQIISPSRASAGIGFAVSSNTVRRVVPELISRGYYPHPWLGARMLSLTPSNADLFREADMNLPVNTGLLVIEVVTGASAENAGIQGGDRMVRFGQYQVPLDGDVIVAINDRAVNNYEELTVYLETETLVGETVDVTIIRDGAEQTIAVTLEERPPE